MYIMNKNQIFFLKNTKLATSIMNIIPYNFLDFDLCEKSKEIKLAYRSRLTIIFYLIFKFYFINNLASIYAPPTPNNNLSIGKLFLSNLVIGTCAVASILLNNLFIKL